jgi:hypothetical protein
MVVSEDRDFRDDHFLVEQLAIVARIIVFLDPAAKFGGDKLGFELIGINPEEFELVIVVSPADLDEVDFSHWWVSSSAAMARISSEVM